MDQTIHNNIPTRLSEPRAIYDPRPGKSSIQDLKVIGNIKDIYEAGLFLTAIFNDERFTIESKGIDWPKVLPKAVPGHKVFITHLHNLVNF